MRTTHSSTNTSSSSSSSSLQVSRYVWELHPFSSHTACVASSGAPACNLSLLLCVFLHHAGCHAAANPLSHVHLMPCSLLAVPYLGGGGGDNLSASVLLDRIFESICRPLKVGTTVTLLVTQSHTGRVWFDRSSTCPCC